MDDMDLLNYDADRSSTHSTGSNGSSRAAMIARSARMIYSAYRRDDFADPEMFVLQLGTILERYSDEVIRQISHPLSGIQRRSKFPPSIAEVVEACDDEAAAIARIAEAAKLPRPDFSRRDRPIEKRHRANVLVHKGAPQYEAMVARSKERRADAMDWRMDDDGRGIWVAFPWLEDEREERGRVRLGHAAAKVAKRA